MTSSDSLDPDAPEVGNWLDQAQSGRLSLEPVPEMTARGDGAAGEVWGADFPGIIYRATTNLRMEAEAWTPRSMIVITQVEGDTPCVKRNSFRFR